MHLATSCTQDLAITPSLIVTPLFLESSWVALLQFLERVPMQLHQQMEVPLTSLTTRFRLTMKDAPLHVTTSQMEQLSELFTISQAGHHCQRQVHLPVQTLA